MKAKLLKVLKAKARSSRQQQLAVGREICLLATPLAF